MSKKGRQLRQYKKQLKQVQKLEKRLKQKGITLTSSEEPTVQLEKTKPEQLIDIKQRKKELEKQLQGKVKVAEPTIRTNEPIKISGKQLRKAIEQRKLRSAKTSTPKASTSNEQSKKKKSKEKKPKDKQLREAIEKRRQKLLEKQQASNKAQQDVLKDTDIPDTTNETKPQHNAIVNHISPSDSFFTEAVINNFRIQISQFPAMAEPMLTNWLDRMIDEFGADDVAKMLQAGAENGEVLTVEIAYSQEKLVGYIARLVDWIPEMEDWYKEELMEQFESWEEFV